MKHALYWIGHFLSRTLYKYVYRLQVTGEQLIPKQGGLLLASNHASYLDPPLVGASLRFRHLDFIARSTLFRNPVFGWVLRQVCAHPIVRGQGPNQDWNSYVRLLDEGAALLVFPEGTRTEDGELQRGKSGFGKLVYLSKKPVYPVYVQGTYEAFPKKGKLRWVPLRVRFGPPVPLDDLLNQPEEKRILREISERTMQAIARLKEELAEGQK